MPTDKSAEVLKEERESRKSRVRVVVTYGAAGFLFLGGPLLILVLLCMGKSTEAANLFTAILPVSAAIISYWFAGRSKAGAAPERKAKD